MARNLLKLALFVAVAGLLGYGLVSQHRAGGRLKAQLTAVTVQAATAAELRRENLRLAAKQAAPAEPDRPRRPLAAPPPRAAAPTGAGTGRSSRLSADQWKLAGRGTPRDAFESVLWAATHQDVDALTGLMSLEPNSRRKAAAEFAQLPEETREKYGSPERIAATMLAANTPANLSAMETLGTTGNAQQATLLMGVERADGTRKDNFFKFEKEEDGWKLIVPAQVLQGYAAQLSGKAALPGSGEAQNPGAAP